MAARRRGTRQQREARALGGAALGAAGAPRRQDVHSGAEVPESLGEAGVPVGRGAAGRAAGDRLRPPEPRKQLLQPRLARTLGVAIVRGLRQPYRGLQPVHDHGLVAQLVAHGRALQQAPH
eukprot:6259180-Prymnesium_polylepis.2